MIMLTARPDPLRPSAFRLLCTPMHLNSSLCILCQGWSLLIALMSCNMLHTVLLQNMSHLFADGLYCDEWH